MLRVAVGKCRSLSSSCGGSDNRHSLRCRTCGPHLTSTEATQLEIALKLLRDSVDEQP